MTYGPCPYVGCGPFFVVVLLWWCYGIGMVTA